MEQYGEGFVGLDAAKLRHAVAVAEDGRQGEVRYLGEVGADTESVRRLAAKLEKRHGRGLHFCYETGPTGYGLYRQLTRLGHRCTVVAPSLILRRLAETRSVCGWGDRVKTNRRDAQQLARLLRAGELTAVQVPDKAHETVRALIRARQSAVEDLRRRRQAISSMMLRHGWVFAGKKTWGALHGHWLRAQRFDHPARVDGALLTLATLTDVLPTGRHGQVLAWAQLLAVLAAAWAAVAAPLLDWHAEREDALQQRATLARRMAQVAAGLPELQRQAAAAAASGPVAATLLDGSSDAVAGATLQQRIQDMAGRAGAALSSTETLPAETVVFFRRIGVRVALSAPWAVLVQLLRAVEEASPQMLVDDLQIHSVRRIGVAGETPLEASFTVLGSRAP